MAVIPATRPRSLPSTRPARRTHRRPSNPGVVSMPRAVQRPTAARATRIRRRSKAKIGTLLVAGVLCSLLAGLTFLLTSLLGHTMLRRSQAQFEDIQARSVFAERDLTRLNKELRQINTLEGLGAMAQAHQLYRDGRTPVVIAQVQGANSGIQAQ